MAIVDQKVEREQVAMFLYNLQGPTPSDSVSAIRSHFLKVIQPSRIVPPAGEQSSKMPACGRHQIQILAGSKGIVMANVGCQQDAECGGDKPLCMHSSEGLPRLS